MELLLETVEIDSQLSQVEIEGAVGGAENVKVGHFGEILEAVAHAAEKIAFSED